MPQNSIAVNVEQRAATVNFAVTNKSNSVGGDCTYNADLVNGLGDPHVGRQFPLGPGGTANLTFLAPLIGSSYQVNIVCNGQGVEFGRFSTTVSR